MDELNYSAINSADVVRPTHLEVNLSVISSNFKKIRDFVYPSKVMPVLKANAYGHGLVRVAQLMQELKADYIGVAVLEEGILLRNRGITIPILVLGGILNNQIPHFLNHNLTITASSIEKMNQIEDAAKELGKRAKVHLKIDTGLERIGVHYYNALNFIKKAFSYNHIEVEGIYSHFANSSSDDLSYTKKQFDRFNKVLTSADELGYKIPVRHFSNSGAIFQFPEANMSLVRPGISLFGISPSRKLKNTIGVIPALTWKSRVVYFKVIKPGHPVGYGSTWESDHNIRAVTIPVGYGDGYMRQMSKKATVIINGKRYPVIGTISMDQIVVNIESDSVFNGDDVYLLGGNFNDSIICDDLADWADTINYEILTNINTRVPRIYID